MDNGDPPLESTVSLFIRVQQVVTMAPELGIGFVSLNYDLTVNENTRRGKVLKSLPLDKTPSSPNAVKCEVAEVRDNKGDLRKGKKETPLSNHQFLK